MISTLLRLWRCYKNWYVVLLMYFNVIHKADITLRNGRTIKNISKKDFGYPFILNDVAEGIVKGYIKVDPSYLEISGIQLNHTNIFLAWRYLQILKNGGKITMIKEDKHERILLELNNGLKFVLPNKYDGVHEVCQVFIEREYDKFDFRNVAVLDIGAFIGDTPIFFAWKGAKKVVAYEPNPYAFKFALKNVHINKLNKKIILHNMAVGSDNSELVLNVAECLGSSSLYTKSQVRSQVKVQVKNILDIIEEDNFDILKLDCEGCEYEILESLIKTGKIKNISKGIILEAHGINPVYRPRYMLDLLKQTKIFNHIRWKGDLNRLALIWAKTK